ncbi:TetR/AcrR family transcriptional regulator [Lactobacillus psittaci]|uniref:Regulatory protein n=1 Tax=Lactobacillus psittaci DSM 15354 TaxID=1122152 RepID=A0A0R1S2M5_9LACO|nr:helix-turn-helix domain-containing protein [Lactobacillus psittaci]KRL61844.1 regulatory protein [Lactobacillus psittaci DSM 15354]
MGRKKKYNSNEVIEAITSVFLQYGYEATSLDDLVKATGLLRGSLYSEFGSKRGMFLAVLQNNMKQAKDGEKTTHLMLVAMLELSRRDKEIHTLIQDWCQSFSNKELELLLGKKLLSIAKIERY